jgi:hypothetical protein
MKKIYALALFLLLIGCSDNHTNGPVYPDWYDKSVSVFTISTAKELAELAELVNREDDFSGKTVKIGANIMLNDTTGWQNWANNPPANEWTPIGTGDMRIFDGGGISGSIGGLSFKGIFDGNGYVVSGLYINSTNSCKGLFGSVEGIIKNIGVNASYVNGDNAAGGLVGCNYYGTISNSYFSGTVTGVNGVGGLMGFNYNDNEKEANATINNSYSTGMVTGNTIVGGLVGYNYKGMITESNSTSTVTGAGEVGGLVGESDGIISHSYSTGTVTGTSYVGGMVGYLSGTIISSHSTSTVTGTNYVGGLVGRLYHSSNKIINSYSTGTVAGDNHVGGFVGFSEGTISNSYSIGTVTGIEYTGGFSGLTSPLNGYIKNSYYDIETSGQSNASGHKDNYYAYPLAQGRTTAYMQSEEFADELNFIAGLSSMNAWVYSAGKYPVLSDKIADVISIDNFATSGNGTEANPYIISTKKQLENFSRLVNGETSFQDKIVKLGTNIILNDTANWQNWASSPPTNIWTPIGINSNCKFNGTFDGNGYVISGVYNNNGLFGYSIGAIKNLGVTASYINGNSEVSGLITNNYGTISNSYFNGIVSSSDRNIGGLAGRNYGIISNSYSMAYVKGEYTVGGLVGINDGPIVNCYFAGKITGMGSPGGPIEGPGGIAGIGSEITNSYYDKETSGQNYGVGNYVGLDYGKTTAEMKQKETFDGWDFDNIWGISDAINNGYPYLLN